MSKKKRDWTWRVTSSKANGIELQFGPELSEAPFSDDQKLHVLGKALINLGTRLLGSSVSDDGDDEWEGE